MVYSLLIREIFQGFIMNESKKDEFSSDVMSETMLKEILEGIKRLNLKMDALERLLMELKIPSVDPTPEEQKIIEEYEKDKEQGNLKFKKFI